MQEKEEFSFSKRLASFRHAGRGLKMLFASAHNAWLHAAILIIALLLGAYFHIARMEWLALILAAGLVLAAEALNSAIEISVDLTSPGYHPHARNAKDVAAGAVLISAIAAFVVGAVIFGPRIFPHMHHVGAAGANSPFSVSSGSPSAAVPKRSPVVAAPYPVAGTADVTQVSPPVFAYAHGTAQADGKFFIGMADRQGNPFPANEIAVFSDPSDLARYALISLPKSGDVETMVYDPVTDKVYLDLSATGGLDLYAIDPHTYAVSAIISTTSIDTGPKPAIVTDGAYIYGITNTDPSTVFKVRIADGALSVSSSGHIPNGHSAAIGIYASTTELYFGGGMSDGFEKADARTLAPIAETDLAGNTGSCSLSDDTPYSEIDGTSGYVYLGCESVPYGKRVRTSDLSVASFPLPGRSLGLFIFDGNLYNTAQDGMLDAFSGLDIASLKRYRVVDGLSPLDTNGQDIQLNELFYSTATQSIYFTAWWGIKGLFEVSIASSSATSSSAGTRSR